MCKPRPWQQRLESWLWKQVTQVILHLRQSRLWPYWIALVRWAQRLPEPPRWAWWGASSLAFALGVVLGTWR